MFLGGIVDTILIPFFVDSIDYGEKDRRIIQKKHVKTPNFTQNIANLSEWE